MTRSQPGAEATAARLRARGFEPVVAPILEIKPLADARVDLSGVAAIAFTSANGVRAFAERSHERGLKVFAVGKATADAAREARFGSVLSTDGDVKALAAALARRKREIKGAILHPGAAEPAGDLAGELEPHGVEVRTLALYESVPAALPEGFAEALPGLWGVLVYSPKAARALAQLLKKTPAPQLRAFCLSKAVARPLARAGLAERLPAPAPNEEALLGLLG
ncbi:MAG TPA: uroporphyrinogen-III synthase [Caulobacteraceae bacterium]|nr:uroporphyrinogen-III synthase [Caulobacteraceae bacterium]